ncbi:MAG TPA: PAS domain-containing protein, partial [Aggregatilineaceae bacterium]|nr:PAS domain-containing protein [Aggregatilineaceae bacterium]
MWAEHLLQALGEGVVVLDTDEQIVYFSAGAERILRWTDAVGRSFTDVFRPAEQTSLLLADYISPA